VSRKVAALKLQGGNLTTCLPGKIHMVAMELFSSVAMAKHSILTPVLQVKYIVLSTKDILINF